MVNRDTLLARRAKLLAQLELVNELLGVEDSAPMPTIPAQVPRPSSQADEHLVEDSEDAAPKAVRLASKGARRKLTPLDLAQFLMNGPLAISDLTIRSEVSEPTVRMVLKTHPQWFQKVDAENRLSTWALTEQGQRDLPVG